MSDQSPESVTITNGVMGVDLPQVQDETTIKELRDLVGKIDYFEDDTEINRRGYGVTFAFQDSSISYSFLRSDYVGVKV